MASSSLSLLTWLDVWGLIKRQKHQRWTSAIKIYRAQISLELRFRCYWGFGFENYFPRFCGGGISNLRLNTSSHCRKPKRAVEISVWSSQRSDSFADDGGGLYTALAAVASREWNEIASDICWLWNFLKSRALSNNPLGFTGVFHICIISAKPDRLLI